jgi:competence protein ComFC
MLDILFPKICLLCNNSTENSVVCTNCCTTFSFIDNSKVCDVCGVPLLGFGEQKKYLCGNCISDHESLLIVRSILLYKDKTIDLLHEFKYNSRLYIADFIADLIIDNFPSDFGGFDTIVPVPLHIRRLRKRGYNQSVLISRVLSRRLNVNIDLFSLKKIKDTDPQVEMSNFRNRHKNIKNSFHVSNNEVFSGKEVLLIDDVYTSGSTIKECSKKILDSGADKVNALTLARAV